MAYINQINITDEEMDKPVYRIMPVHRLLECFQKKQLVLVKPKNWDDPYENLLLNATVLLQDGSRGDMQSIRDRVYGQCWTLHSETDAMWRIYSSEKNGAKVKSTPRKLLAALKKSVPTYGDIQCFVGRVQYKKKQELLSTLQSLDLLNTNGSGVAESLMYKRNEFRHEREVRIIYTGESKDVYPFHIEPNDLFEKVVFDPRMDFELYRAYKAAIRNKGFSKRIGQSVLYKPPDTLTIKI